MNMQIGNKYNFSYECKKEICTHYLTKKEEIYYLFSSFLNNNAEIIINKQQISYEFITPYIDVIKLFKQYFSDDELTIFVSNKKTLKYNSTKYKVLIAPNNKQKNEAIQKLFLSSKNNKKKSRAFIAGLFLASGSVTNVLSKNKHLEFRISNDQIFEETCYILKKFKIEYKDLFHHNKKIIYIKKIQCISDLLSIMNATNCMLFLEEQRITSDFVNTCQRLNNLDISNLSKSTKCNNEINEIILKIKSSPLFNKLSLNLKIYCQTKLDFPTLSMSEILIQLNKRLSKEVTKSWINHANIKLRKLIEQI